MAIFKLTAVYNSQLCDPVSPKTRAPPAVPSRTPEPEWFPVQRSGKSRGATAQDHLIEVGGVLPLTSQRFRALHRRAPAIESRLRPTRSTSDRYSSPSPRSLPCLNVTNVGAEAIARPLASQSSEALVLRCPASPPQSPPRRAQRYAAAEPTASRPSLALQQVALG